MTAYVTGENIEQKAGQWLKAIAPYNLHKMEINRDASVLLVIDMQRRFLEKDSPVFTAGGTAIISNIQRLIEAFRKAGRPVIYTTHVHHPSGCDAGILGWWWDGMIIEGSRDAEITDELAPMPGEVVIKKHRYSAFYNTDLEVVLRGLNIEDVVISGVMTNLCCETTARDAYLRDFRVFFPADANGAACEEMQLATLTNLAFGFAYVTTADKVIGGLQK